MVLGSQSTESGHRYIAKICGFFAPAFFPPLHIGILYYFWNQYARKVDRHFCSCSCWDTVFKGTYESGIASYKHMYFNATSNTLKMWVVTVVFVLGLYECVRYLALLALQHRLRASMLVLFLSSIFAHYYAWWAYINYWNDEFYSQWNHQLFFTVTELASTALVLRMADASFSVTPRAAFGVAAIATLHLVTGARDQFVDNLVRGAGHTHQVVRDLGLMVPDVLHLVLPLVELARSKHRASASFGSQLRREMTGLVLLVVGGFIVCEQL
ncbi:uncharacterized protein LOC124719101 [Schistocerca piceifrons]|uniref:uncharacterized protein LOC124719101 n=1 Tax=Schistocerca piceifrons TaxID=274613 RepID=UPI001F5F1BD6|nr:uncharacterized protein LOC124719101 [Schistocerca piceifrons]